MNPKEFLIYGSILTFQYNKFSGMTQGKTGGDADSGGKVDHDGVGRGVPAFNGRIAAGDTVRFEFSDLQQFLPYFFSGFLQHFSLFVESSAQFLANGIKCFFRIAGFIAFNFFLDFYGGLLKHFQTIVKTFH